MAILMVRKPSETQNISPIDDIVPFRYAYGNQDGYVIGRGTEIDNEVNGNQITIKSGRLVIQGVESDIDANGVTITIDSVSETRYYTLYHEIDLGTNTANIKLIFDFSTYPNVPESDDLTINSTGVANLKLYQFTATNGVILNVEKVVKPVKYVKDIEVVKSKSVNGIEFIKDENGIIKVGDIVIPQKQVIWEGEITTTADEEGTLGARLEIRDSIIELKEGDVIEVTLKMSNSDIIVKKLFFKDIIHRPINGNIYTKQFSIAEVVNEYPAPMIYAIGLDLIMFYPSDSFTTEYEKQIEISFTGTLRKTLHDNTTTTESNTTLYKIVKIIE